MNNPISVLLPVYIKEHPKFLDAALSSVMGEQSTKPAEVIVVKDGPLSKELDDVILKYQNISADIDFHVVSLDKNIGLGDALQHGLQQCNFDIVARMDSDDISHPKRFEKQYNFLTKNPDVSLVGSYVHEFEHNLDDSDTIRTVPLSYFDIVTFAKKRCPFNHPSVMFRKSDILEVGGYKKFIGLEDYFLWVRLIVSGKKLANIPEALLSMRGGEPMLSRRGGLGYLKQEFLFHYHMYSIGFITFSRFVANLGVRIPLRLFPTQVRGYIYKLSRSKKL